jgi:hypothetical protein
MKPCAPLWILTLLLISLIAAPAQGEISFNRDIRPILAEACYHCHGPDPGTRKAGLRFDTEAGFFDPKSGPTVVKGQPDQSPLFQRLISKDPDEVMPPPDSHNQLKSSQISLIKQWIAEGAPWQPHWSFITPQRPEPPTVKTADWVRNPIDAFVLSKLEAAGLAPAPEADPLTLIRRITLDLTGLPPEPELLARYAPNGTTAPLDDDRYAELIDELLKRPSYGEHRGRYWLDAARYADTHGLHFDNYREMWPYRDWVIDAFNRNLPFDQFTVEQIAGDLLPNPTRSNSSPPASSAATSPPTKAAPSTRRTSPSTPLTASRPPRLGLSRPDRQLRQCHDHKFDPVSHARLLFDGRLFPQHDPGARRQQPQGCQGPTSWCPRRPTIAPAGPPCPLRSPPPPVAARHRRKAAAKPEFESWLAYRHRRRPRSRPAIPMPSTSPIPLNEGAGNEVGGTCGGPMTSKPPARSPGLPMANSAPHRC